MLRKTLYLANPYGFSDQAEQGPLAALVDAYGAAGHGDAAFVVDRDVVCLGESVPTRTPTGWWDAYVRFSGESLGELLRSTEFAIVANNLLDKAYRSAFTENAAWLGAPRTISMTRPSRSDFGDSGVDRSEDKRNAVHPPSRRRQALTVPPPAAPGSAAPHGMRPGTRASGGRPGRPVPCPSRRPGSPGCRTPSPRGCPRPRTSRWSSITPCRRCCRPHSGLASTLAKWIGRPAKIPL